MFSLSRFHLSKYFFVLLFKRPRFLNSVSLNYYPMEKIHDQNNSIFIKISISMFI